MCGVVADFCLAAKPLTFQQLLSALMSKEILAVYEEEVIEALIELFIIRGVIYKEGNVFKLNPGDACPVDFARMYLIFCHIPPRPS